MGHEDGDASVGRGLAARIRAALPRRRRVTLEQGMLGFGVERRGGLVEHEHQRALAHETPGQRELLPLPEAELYALGPGGAELGLETRAELLDHVAGAGPVDGRRHRRSIVEAGQITHTPPMADPELETVEVFKSTPQPGPPGVPPHAPERPPLDEDA